MRNSTADRWFGVVLRCYPHAFRARFEPGMRDALRCEHAQARADGAVATVIFWFWTLVEAVRFGWAARRPRTQEGFSMASLFTVDIRDALRSLRASPVVTVVAVLSLALGIGANTALFSILNSLLLKSLPVRDPGQLVVIDDGSWTNPIWEQIRDQRREIFADAFAWSTSRFNLSPRGETDFVEGAWASGGMFDVLGVQAAIGRTFTLNDDARDGGADGPVAVISYNFWQRRMGAAPDVIGRKLTLDGLDVTIIGVAPRGFFGPDVGRTADIIVPLNVIALVPGQARMLDGRSTWWLEIMGRLKPGQTIDQAAARLNAARPQIRQATLPPDWRAKDQDQYLTKPLALVSAATGESNLRSSYERPLRIVLGVVAAVLAIACANLANLLLARAASRKHELSLRLALGASRFRLAKQLLAETAILASAGAALGLMVAQWGSALLVRQLATPGSGVTLDLSLDWRVLAFTAAVTGATALVFGIAPVVGLSGVSANDAVKEQSRSVTGDRRFGVRNVLVAIQVALSLALLIGGVLFVRTLTALSGTKLGFDAGGLVVINVDARRNDEARAARLALYERLREAASAVPGVSATAVSVLTPVGSMRWNTIVEPTPATAALAEKQRLPWVNVVSPGWFRTFGMRIIAGRDIDDHDVTGSERVLVVNESFARRFFGQQSAVGQHIRTGLEGPNVYPYRIVGVVNDAVYSSARRGFEPTIYAPLAQLEDVGPSAVITVRASGALADTLGRELSAAMNRAEPRISFTIRPLSGQLRASIRQERLVALLAGFFGALALLLAAVGLYGVASHSVTQRRGEIGIRMALGADPRGVVRLVLGRLAWLLAFGIALGVATSWWTVQLFEKLLFGLAPRDPLTFTTAVLVLVFAGLLAGWFPARRAARIDPVSALREI
jgi:predicted permease